MLGVVVLIGVVAFCSLLVLGAWVVFQVLHQIGRERWQRMGRSADAPGALASRSPLTADRDTGPA